MTHSVWPQTTEDSDNWIQLEKGFAFGSFQNPFPTGTDEEPIYILRIDGNTFEVNLYCSSEYGDKKRNMREWAEDFGLLASINAGMFATDFITSIGYLKSGRHINNPNINSRHRTIFACQPLDSTASPIKIIDLACDDFAFWQNRYDSFLQSIRMISCNRKNVWQQQTKKWSISALGMDKSDNLLLMHSPTPRSVHDFINILLVLPIEIKSAMYLEGGAQAELYFNSGGLLKDLRGKLNSGNFFQDNNDQGWPIPNIIGVKRPAR